MNRNGTLDILIEGGLVVSDGVKQMQNVGIREGKIACLLSPSCKSSLLRPKKVIDATECLVVPGGIDAHTHLYWPIIDEKRSCDTFESGSIAAALGGTTTIIDFVPVPGKSSLIDAFRRRKEEAEGKAVIDFSFHSTVYEINKQRIKELEHLVEEGVSSLKVFTCGASGINEGELLELLLVSGELGLKVGLHAENDAIIRKATEVLIRQNLTSTSDFPKSRPLAAEEIAVRSLLYLAEKFDSPIHLFHLSSTLAGYDIQLAQKKGVRVTAETCPHYLLFNEDVYSSEKGYQYLISPPIRSESERLGLWQLISEGTITCISSDSIAYDLQTKASHKEDFRKVPYGAAGIRFRSGLLFEHGVKTGLITSEQWVELTSTGPAKAFDLYPNKGTIRTGSEADLLVFDPRKQMTVSAVDMELVSGYTIFESLPCSAGQRVVIKGGQVIVSEGEFVGTAGSGKYVKRYMRRV